MGFLGDVGRSNAAQTGQSIFGDVLRYKQMERQGNMDALTTAHTMQSMDIQNAEEARKAKVFNDSYTPVNINDLRQNYEQNGQKDMFDVLYNGAQSRGMIQKASQPGPDGKPVEFIYKKDMQQIPKLLSEDHTWRWQAGMAGYNSIDQQAKDIQGQAQKLAEKMKDPSTTMEDKTNLEAKFKDLADQYQPLAAQRDKMFNNLVMSDPTLGPQMAMEQAKQNKPTFAHMPMTDVGGTVQNGVFTPSAGTGGQMKGTVKGFDPKTGEAVTEDPFGNLTSGGKPYTGGPMTAMATPTGLETAWLNNFRKMNPNATPAQENEAIAKHQKDTLAARIPAYVTGAGMPPGYVLNRRTGAYEWKGEGTAPGMDPATSAQYKSDAASLAFQQKSRDMMAGFVQNMNKQVDRLGAITQDLTRYDTRLLNVPLVKLRKEVAGSPIESKVGMYVKEISNEIGKISTGSSASVRELSTASQEKWDKIHDANLSINDLMSLLNETKHAGQIRIQSSDSILAETKKRLGGGGNPAANVSDPYGIR